jgi:hypothetical protein
MDKTVYVPGINFLTKKYLLRKTIKIEYHPCHIQIKSIINGEKYLLTGAPFYMINCILFNTNNR